jgi:hypothetical protein
MNIKKRVTKSNYTQVLNAFLNDSELSFKSKGLFCYMISKPDDWTFTLNSIASQTKDGIDSISTAMRELKKKGYVHYKKFSSGSGIYLLSENPNFDFTNLGNSPCISNKELNSNKDLSKGEQMNFEDILPIETEKEKPPKEEYFFPEPKNQWELLWKEWIDHRKREKIKSFKSEKSENIAKNQLVKISNGNIQSAIEIVEKSISSNYQGLFPLKNKKNGTEQSVKDIAGF